MYPDKSFWHSSFNINHDLTPLVYMIKKLSLVLSPVAKQRLSWMDAYREWGDVSRVCRHFSIPRATFYRWYKRYDPFHLKSLENESRKPHRSPRRTESWLEQRVLTMKQKHPRWGKEKMAYALHRDDVTVNISSSTSYRILKRYERILRYRTRKRKPPKPRVDWEKIHRPGDAFQVDVKYVTAEGGKRMYQYTAIDVISRWRFIEMYSDRDQDTTVRFLTQLLRLTPANIQMIQTDNGGEFGKRVSAWLARHTIHHVFTHKQRPTENAYVERSHRTDEEEFYSLTPIPSSLVHARKILSQYLHMYNHDRPHWGLGGKTPVEYLQSCNITVSDVLT